MLSEFFSVSLFLIEDPRSPDSSVLLRPEVQWHILVIPKPQEWLLLPKLCKAEGYMVALWNSV